MFWFVRPASDLGERYAGAWDRLNAAHRGAHPLLDMRFVGRLVEHFGTPETRLAGLEDGDELRGLALVEPTGMGRWNVFLPGQMPIGAMIVPVAPDESDDALAGLLRALPGPGWLLGLVNQDPLFPGAPVPEDTTRHERLVHASTIGLDVEGTFDDYWAGRNRKLRENLRRAYRKLEKENLPPRLEGLRDRAAMAGAVADHGELESAGWKGREGSAIHRDNVQGRFYTGMLEDFAGTDGARVWRLWLGDRLAASQLAIRNGPMMVLLKTTYDEELSRFGPGRLMQHMILQDVFASGESRVVEFYTAAGRQDSDWTTHSREIYHLNVYRSAWVRSMVSAARGVRGRDEPDAE